LDASLNWSKGIILNTLNEKNNQMERIYQWQWAHPRWGLDWEGVRSKDKITFSNNPAQAISNGHFTLKNAQTHEQIVIILNKLGRVRITSRITCPG
jgi:Tfp pilus assembly protein FimT